MSRPDADPASIRVQRRGLGLDTDAAESDPLAGNRVTRTKDQIEPENMTLWPAQCASLSRLLSTMRGGLLSSRFTGK